MTYKKGKISKNDLAEYLTSLEFLFGRIRRRKYKVRKDLENLQQKGWVCPCLSCCSISDECLVVVVSKKL